MGFGAFAENEEIIKSKISEVTVYSQGAQIFQKGSFSVKPGISYLIIEGISPYIDANSLQVKAAGSVIILDSKYSIFYPKPEPVSLEGLPLKIKKDILLLEDSIKNLSYEIADINDEIAVLQATKSILQNNGAIRGQGKVNDSIALLKEAVDYYATKMQELNKKHSTLSRKLDTKNNVKKGMTERLNGLRNYQSNPEFQPKNNGPIHRITITVSAETAAVGKLDVSYLVSNAGWVPLYDLRSEPITGKVNLTYKAHVFQNTGIDWDDVRLNISTNNPYQNKTKPTLHPWYIDYYVYRNVMYDKKARANTTPAPSSAVKEQAESAGYYQTDEAYQDALTSDQFVNVINQTISAEFRIDLPYTIKSDNEKHMVLIKNEDLKANFTYFTVPKLDASVYLVAQISKLDELQLVPAKANIFFDGTYMGETYLDPTTMDDTLNLSLGKDPNIIVKRTLMKKDSKEKIVGNMKERTFAYMIEVKNLKSSSFELIVEDQIPITQNADIEIELLDDGKAKYDKTTGKLEWTINLKAKESKDLKFSFKVKHNKDQHIPL